MPPRIRLPPTITSSRLLLSTRPAAFPPSQRCIIILAKPMGLHHPPPHRRSFGSTPSRRDPDNELPSAKEERRSSLAKNFSSRLDHMQAAIFMAGQKINDLTGYSGIETLKKDIDAQEAGLSAAKANVQIAKAEYKAAIARRSDSQKEVNELLQRKHTWSPHDLERFTELYRSDHANEQAEIQAQNRLNEVEKEVESASSLLSKSILTRYHEEQVWSDKIRRASTWGTWMLMGINIALFIVVQLGLEPWKRRRLVNNFEEKVKIMLQEEKALVLMAVTPAGAAATAAPENQVPATVAPVAPAVEESLPVAMPKNVVQEVKIEPVIVEDAEKVPVEPAVTATPDLRDVVQDATAVDDVATLTGATKSLPSVVKERVWGLVSEDVVSLTQRDLTFYIAQGFAAGAVVAVGIVSVSMRGK